MKIRPSILALAIVAVGVIAGVKALQWWSHRLRFDGVYQRYTEPIGLHERYYRFYPDGTVLSHTGDEWAPAEEAKTMYRGSRWVYEGHYSRDGASISITVPGYDGSSIPADSNEATVEAFKRAPHTKTYYLTGEVRVDRIEITSADGFGEYRFVKVPLPNET